MSYIKADEVLPQNIVEMIQQYIDGENIYIPKKDSNRIGWGEKSGTRNKIYQRNVLIYKDYLNGIKVSVLSKRYFLSDKSIWRIIRNMRISESV